MGNPAILFGSDTLSLEALSTYQAAPVTRHARHTADGGVTETCKVSEVYEVTFSIEDMDMAGYGAALGAWWAYAKPGNAYTFVADSEETVATTLAVGASAGDNVIEPVSLIGIVVDDVLMLRSTDLQREERVRVRLLNLLGGTFQIYSTLKYDWNAGELIRSHRYWPSVVSIDTTRPWTENPGGTVSLIHRFREAA